MTTTEAGPPADPTVAPSPSTPSGAPRRRRRPAPRAHPFWRFVFPLVVVGAGIAVFLVWQDGTKAVLDSTDGTEIELVTDPAAPGYVAFVEPTPTMLVTHVGSGGELVGVSVLARTALDNGGTVVVLSADMLVENTDDPTGAAVLSERFAEQGTAGVATLVGDLFGFGFREVLEIDSESLGRWMGLVEPVPFVLVDDLVEASGDTEVAVFGAGGLELTGEQGAAIYEWRNPAEFDANRTQRQGELWSAWLDTIGRAEDLVAATLPFEDGLSPYLRSLGTGTTDVSVLPLAAAVVTPDAAPLYVLDDEGAAWLADRAAAMVPLPVASHPGARLTVRLLDGTGDAALRDRLIPVLVEAGAEISVIGNAPAFDVAETVVAHHRAESEAGARALAAAIGGELVFDDDPDQPLDLTVTVGSDQETS